MVEILREGRIAVPRYFLALVAAGVRTGSLGDALQDFAEFREANDDQWRSVRSTLVYPAIVLLLAVAILVGVITWVVPQLENTFLDFHADLPLATKLLVWLANGGLLWVGAVLGAFAIVCVLLRLLSGARFTNALVSAVPFIGPMWRLSHWTQFSRLVAVLVERGIPLPEALPSPPTPRATNRSRARPASLHGVLTKASGFPSAPRPAQFPPTLKPVVRWGESVGSLATAMRTAGEMFAARLDLQTRLVRVVAGPITFLAVALVTMGVIGALVYPLISLILRTFRDGCMIWRSIILWTLMAVLGGLVLFVFGVPGILFWIAVVAIAGMAYSQHVQTRRDALVSLLAIAVERQMPLAPLVVAFEEEAHSPGLRSLAVQLNMGDPLALALFRSGNVVSDSAYVAAIAGESAGKLDQSLRDAAASQSSRIWFRRLVGEQTMYMLLVVLFAIAVISFQMIKIYPAMSRIYQDFALDLPRITRAMGDVSEFFSDSGLAAVLSLTALAAAVLALLYYSGVVSFRLPIVGRLFDRLDSAAVLRALALSAERQQALNQVLAALATAHPSSRMRKRLAQRCRRCRRRPRLDRLAANQQPDRTARGRCAPCCRSIG